MTTLLFSKPTKSIGIDIGTHSIKAVQMSKRGGRLRVETAGYCLIDREQVNADPVEAHASAVREALRNMAVPQAYIVGALPGQTVVIRHPRLPDVNEDQLASAIEREASQNIPYDLSEVFLDWTILDEIIEGENRQLKALLVAAKHEVIDSRIQIADVAQIQYHILSVDSMAVADAAEACDFLRVGETVAMLNLGASSASIHFIKDGISNFIRDVSWGARELIQAIAKSNRCDYDQAERLLYEAVENRESPPQPEPELPPAPVPEEPDAGGLGDAGLDSGASLLDPLNDELCDLTEPMPAAAPAPEPPGSGRKDMAEVLSLPVSRLVAEVRRSLEYYEHQLYEQPVGRIILSGGVAQLPLLRSALLEEIEVSEVQVANPLDSALIYADHRAQEEVARHPAQFVVAIGLAARGAAEL